MTPTQGSLTHDPLPPSLQFGELVSLLQTAVAQTALAVRSHLAETKRPVPDNKPAREAKAITTRLTRDSLIHTVAQLEDAMAELRIASRDLCRTLHSIEINNTP